MLNCFLSKQLDELLVWLTRSSLSVTKKQVDKLFDLVDL